MREVRIIVSHKPPKIIHGGTVASGEGFISLLILHEQCVVEVVEVDWFNQTISGIEAVDLHGFFARIGASLTRGWDALGTFRLVLVYHV